jgi:hypothetical protein
VKKVYPIDSPIKKRKPQYDLNDTRLSSLKYKFQDRLTWQENETARTESLGGDDIFINKNVGTKMVNGTKELHSCENTQSLFGGCMEVDSINGIESQSMRKRASVSSSSSNNVSSDAYSSFNSCGTKETDSWVRPHLEHDHLGLMMQPYDDDIERMYDVMNELASGGVDGSADHIMDEKLYSNGVDDFMLLPAGKTGCHGKHLRVYFLNLCLNLLAVYTWVLTHCNRQPNSGEKKLTIDQEFEQYFSKLML